MALPLSASENFSKIEIKKIQNFLDKHIIVLSTSTTFLPVIYSLLKLFWFNGYAVTFVSKRKTTLALLTLKKEV